MSICLITLMHCNAVLVSWIMLHGIRIIKTGVNDKLDGM